MNDLNLNTTDGLLDAVDQYADYWFGRRDLRDVFAFLLGHRCARFRDPAGLTADDLKFDAFQDWLISEFCGPDESWWTALGRRSGSPEEAFRYFFHLYRHFGAASGSPAAIDD